MNFPLSRSDIVIHRNFDNEIEVFVKDADKKPVDLTGFNLTATVVDPVAQKTLISVPVTVANAVGGFCRFNVGRLDAAGIPPGYYQYCISVARNGRQELLYMDRGYKATGTVHVPSGPLPGDQESIVVSEAEFHAQDARLLSGSYPGAATVGNIGGVHTVSFYTTNFSGLLEIQATLDAEPSVSDEGWATVEGGDLISATGLQDYTFIGAYNWLRFVVTPSSGSFEKIVFRN